ncbi:MAG: hypothetical protein E4G96_00750 [Chrysiogenales bacterium]|nr:MAG: hypothetical protein E4G96_00750 [Chrysiogenales bacterium]
MFICFLLISFINCVRSDLYDNADKSPLALVSLQNPASHVDRMYLFTGPISNGDLGGRAGADNLCLNQRNSLYSFMQISTVKAFISVSSADPINALLAPSMRSLPVYGMRQNGTETLVSDTWYGLWDGAIATDLSSALGVPADTWWSGSTAGGLQDANLCGHWTLSQPWGKSGDLAKTDAAWIESIVQDCNANSQRVLCMAY